MFLFAHLAAGYLTARIINVAARRHRLEVGWTVFGGILPDLIDKPLSFLPGMDAGRSIAHSLLFLLLLGLASIPWRRVAPVAIGVATHLILDDPSRYPETLLWPLLGPFTQDDDMSFSALVRHLSKPRTEIAEVLGFVILAALAVRHIVARRRQRQPVTATLARTEPVAAGVDD